MTLTDRIASAINDAFNDRRNALVDGQADHAAVAVELVTAGLAACKRKFRDVAAARGDERVVALIETARGVTRRLRNERFLAASLDASVSAWELSLGGEALDAPADDASDMSRPTGAEWALKYLEFFELRLIDAALVTVKTMRNDLDVLELLRDDDDDDVDSESSSCTLGSSSSGGEEEDEEEDEEEEDEEDVAASDDEDADDADDDIAPPASDDDDEWTVGSAGGAKRARL